MKELLGDTYQDFDLVIAQEDGRPFEERMIAKKLEAEFFQQNKKAAADETIAVACQLLQDNPELAKLLLAMHTAAS